MLNTQQIEPSRYAFFDVDDTVISTKSMFSFIKLYFEHYPNPELQHSFNHEMKQLLEGDTSWNIVNTQFYQYFKHFSVANIEAVCQLWFEKYAYNNDHFYHKNIVRQLKQHQETGVQCVFVSGSFRELLQLIAVDLDVKHILSINVERKDLMYTGKIIPPQTIGKGKAQAIALFLKEHQGDAKTCFAYGDDISDVPMLEVVGHPIAVAGGRRLESYATNLGWKIIQPD